MQTRHAHYGGFDAEKRVQKFTRDGKITKRESRSSSKPSDKPLASPGVWGLEVEPEVFRGDQRHREKNSPEVH